MVKEFIINEGVNLIKRTAFCHNSNPTVYMSWEKSDPVLGIIYFTTFWVDHQINGKILKTVGACYKPLKSCLLKEFADILDNKKFKFYNSLFDSSEEAKKYLVEIPGEGCFIKFDEVKSLSDYHEFDKEKIEDIILENLKRKYKDFILNTTDDFIYFSGLPNKEINTIIDAKNKFKEDFNNRVIVGIIPPDVKIKKIDFINSVEDIPTQESKGYDIETGGLDDIFEIKTNIYR